MSRSPMRHGVGHQLALDQVERGQRGGAADRVAAVRRAVGAALPGADGLPATKAPIGMPEPSPLAVSRMSGSTPSCSQAHIFPVRPTPHCTSSATSRMPCRSQSSRRSRSHPAGGTMYPPSPCTGSTKMAATSLGSSCRVNSSCSMAADAAAVALVLVGAELTAVPVGEGDVVHVREQGAEAGVLPRLARGEGHRARGPAVERPAEGDDRGAPGGVAGQLDRPLGRLGAGVGEEHSLARRARGEPRRAARRVRPCPRSRSRSRRCGGTGRRRP